MGSTNVHEPTTPTAVAGADLISGLHDDLLQRILSFLPAASEVARTSVLSRRWRHLWPNAVALRFTIGSKPSFTDYADEINNSRSLVAAADATLARRVAAGGLVEALEINFVYGSVDNTYISLPSKGKGWYLFLHRHAADITSAHVAAWLRFAERQVTGSFNLALPTLLGPELRALTEEEKKRVAELPASARAKAMSLSLGHAILTVPAAGAGAFHALADLLLSHARIEPGGAAAERNLGHLLSSSCCPRLRRLRLEHIDGLAALRLDAAATLEALRLDQLRDLASLELDAPGLRALHVAGCHRLADDGATARISAPRLEVLACADACRPDRLQFDGAATVRRLEKIFLWSHLNLDGFRDVNAGALWLLQRCTAAVSLSVDIAMPLKMEQWNDIQEMTSHVPELPNVTNLSIDIHRGQWHNLRAIIAGLIRKCSRLERLSIGIESANDCCSNPHCFCNGKDDHKISVQNLREVNFTGFHPSEYHMSFVQLMMEGAPALERMTVELYIGKELDITSIPCDRGHWMPCYCNSSKHIHIHNKTYEWTVDKKREGECKRSSCFVEILGLIGSFLANTMGLFLAVSIMFLIFSLSIL